jgi:hypothetical protein
MAVFSKEGLLVTKNGRFQVEELVNKLSFVSGTYLAEFLQLIGLSVPRKLRMSVLSSVLKDPVEQTIEERKTLADEMGYRLTWFNKFTETQLVNLLEWYQSPSLGNLYLVGFWQEILSYMVKKGVGDNDLERLFKAADSAIGSNKRPITKSFNQALDKILYDESGEIDGVSQVQFRPVTYKATTLTELRGIGEKYNAPIPKRLKKSEMLEIILDKLKERNALTSDLEKKLNTQNIILLERFAKDHDIKVSTELKKEEIIEFILANAEETKSTYFVPQSQEVYEKDDITVTPVVAVKVEPKREPKPEPKPEVIETPKVEEKPVVEKVVEPSPSVIVQAEQIDYRPQLEKLSEAFSQLASAFEKKEFTVKVENTVQPAQVVQVEQPIKEEPKVEAKPQIIPLTTTMVSQELLIQELMKDDENDVPEMDANVDLVLDESQPLKVVSHKKKPKVFLAIIALLFSLAFAWVALLGLDFLIAPFLIEANQMFDDLEPMIQQIVIYGSFGLSAISLIIFFVLLFGSKKDVKVVDKPVKRKVFVKGLAVLFSLIFTAVFAWVALLGLDFLISPFLVEANQIFDDLEPMIQQVVIYGSIAFAAINLFITIVLFTRPKKSTMKLMGTISLVTGVLITGLLIFASSKSEAESKKTNLGTQSDVDKIVDAIEKISKPTKKVKKRGFIQSFFGLIMMLVLIVLLIFAALYAVWRLDITYGYENIELIGTLLRDEVIIPLFGSAHYLA